MEVACTSTAGFQRCESGNQLRAVVREWGSTDVLLRLNALELLLQLSEAPSGFDFLLGQGAIASLCDAMSEEGPSRRAAHSFAPQHASPYALPYQASMWRCSGRE